MNLGGIGRAGKTSGIERLDHVGGGLEADAAQLDFSLAAMVSDLDLHGEENQARKGNRTLSRGAVGLRDRIGRSLLYRGNPCMKGP
jgi:hypothetical protein